MESSFSWIINEWGKKFEFLLDEVVKLDDVYVNKFKKNHNDLLKYIETVKSDHIITELTGYKEKIESIFKEVEVTTFLVGYNTYNDSPCDMFVIVTRAFHSKIINKIDGDEELLRILNEFKRLKEQSIYWFNQINERNKSNPYKLFLEVMRKIVGLNPLPKDAKFVEEAKKKFGNLFYVPQFNFQKMGFLNRIPDKTNIKKELESIRRKDENNLKEQITSIVHQLRRELRNREIISQLVFRYKQRVELYDYERMWELISKQENKFEHSMKLELCAYLFDNGLLPLYEISVGRGILDILDKTVDLSKALLVETKFINGDKIGKKTKDKEEAKQKIIETIKTVIAKDTLPQIFEYLESIERERNLYVAYLVVFCKGGKVFPRTVSYQIGMYRIHIININLSEKTPSELDLYNQVAITRKDIEKYIPEGVEVKEITSSFESCNLLYTNLVIDQVKEKETNSNIKERDD
ncbi:hypothetical protein EU534_01240 [Candidatus Heimdallarchaeota archaeon]|nr:MAG: hypothetical protein EU534_01240 [Candidatus Heimdallarchaeota archaeon]